MAAGNLRPNHGIDEISVLDVKGVQVPVRWSRCVCVGTAVLETVYFYCGQTVTERSEVRVRLKCTSPNLGRMSAPWPQKTLDQTMASMRMASSRPAWMSPCPVAAGPVLSLTNLEDSPIRHKRACLIWPPSASEPEEDQNRLHRASVLEELGFGASTVPATPQPAESPKTECTVAGRLEESTLPTTPTLLSPANLEPTTPVTPATPKPAGTDPVLAIEDVLPSIEVVDSNTMEVAVEPNSQTSMEIPAPWALMCDTADMGQASSPARHDAVAETASKITSRKISKKSKEVSVVKSDAALLSKAAEPKPQTSIQIPALLALPYEAADMGHASKGKSKKISKKPDKFFKQVVQPKLEAGSLVDLPSYLAEWGPARLKAIRSAMRDPSYDVVRAEARTISTSYDDLTIY